MVQNLGGQITTDASNRFPLALKLALSALFVGLTTAHAAEGSLPATTLTHLSFDQKLNAQVDLQLPFKDENGKDVRLDEYFHKRPVILDLGYYECPMLCSLVLNGLIESLQSVDGSVGKDFDILCVSVSPTETPALAAAKKRNYTKRYGRVGSAQGWHFLTGQEPAIKKLAAIVGFNYAYDPAVKQYAHPSGIVVLTPDGKVAKYFFGVSYTPSDLQAALDGARKKKVGSPVEQLLILCCSFLPLVGKHSATVMMTVRIAGVAVMVALFGYILVGFCRKPAAALVEAAPAPRENRNIGS